MSSRIDSISRMLRLVQVARMYYEDNLSQSEIAKKLEISRPYVSRLLNEVKEEGIVKISISSSFQMLSLDETRIKEHFNLKNVIIVPKSADINPLKQVGEAAAKYLDSIVKDGDVVGHSWGETLYSVSLALPNRDDLKNVVTVQLCGGVSNTKKKVYVSEIPMLISSKWGSTGYMMPFPALLDSRATVDIIVNESTFKEALNYGEKTNIFLFTVGGFSPGSALVRAGYLHEEEFSQLLSRGAVGDVGTHIINEKGQICDRQIDDRTIAYPFEDIKKIETRICVAVGAGKAQGILATLESGISNVLITDETAVEAIRDLRPEIFNE